MTNLYVFWRLATDPPAPWTRLTRTNQYLRFDSWVGNHWGQVGSWTHQHPSVSGFAVGTSVHGGQLNNISPHSLQYDDIMRQHSNHAAPESYTLGSANNTPLGLGLDIIYVDLTTWENQIRSFPEGTVIMSNGVLVDANLSRYSTADGKFIFHGEPEVVVGTSVGHTNSVAGTLGMSYGVSYVTAHSESPFMGGDRSLNHNHTFDLVSEAKYVEPKALLTRLYLATQDTSKALADTVVFVDGSVGSRWEILTAWAGGNLKAGDSNPSLSGSDTHTQTFSGNSSTYNGGPAFRLAGSQVGYDYHYHPISGTLDAANHVPPSRLIVPARLLTTVYKRRGFGAPQVIGLW